MKTELNREEFREQIIEAFDKTNPDSYSRNAIFSEIEDRLEDSSGKCTVMQSMFRVRRICMVSLAFLIIAALSGGTYSAVSIFRGNNSNLTDEQGQSASGNSGNSDMDRTSENNQKSKVEDNDKSSDDNQNNKAKDSSNSDNNSNIGNSDGDTDKYTSKFA